MLYFFNGNYFNLSKRFANVRMIFNKQTRGPSQQYTPLGLMYSIILIVSVARGISPVFSYIYDFVYSNANSTIKVDDVKTMDGSINNDINNPLDDKLELICDGGIRRGTHILKAISEGADSCSGGRLYLYALAAGGMIGVTKAIENLKNEIIRDMKLMGKKSISELSRKNIRY